MPKLKKELHKIGHDVFIVGVLIAVALGALLATNLVDMVTAGAILILLVILGTITGAITVTLKEEVPFLMAAVTLMLGAAAAPFLPLDVAVPGLGTMANLILRSVAIFVTPVAIIVALKAVYVMSK